MADNEQFNLAILEIMKDGGKVLQQKIDEIEERNSKRTWWGKVLSHYRAKKIVPRRYRASLDALVKKSQAALQGKV